MKKHIVLPKISDEEKTPLVKILLELIEHQSSIIQLQSEEIQKLKDEIARLKNQNKKPDIKPSRLENRKRRKKKTKRGRKSASSEMSKTEKLTIYEEIPIEPDQIPEGSVFKYTKPFVVQGLRFESYNIRYQLKVYETPSGKLISGELPEELDGKHYSPELICFILYQYHHCHVTQPLLWEQLNEIGIDISQGQLSNIITKNKDRYHQEKENILEIGLKYSSHVNVDDTGARHQGKNGYCTHIGNESFSWFESTFSKSRINFLKLMRGVYDDYHINVDAIVYMADNNLPKAMLKSMGLALDRMFANDSQWEDFLKENDIIKERHRKIATEGALIGSIMKHGVSRNLVIVSDDAGQFNVLLHALCWVHAERLIAKIIPYTDQATEDLETVRDRIWEFYKGLKAYKENPDPKDKERLDELFDEIFTTKTSSAMLNEALKRILRNKSELLLVLDRPEIPLHNNTAEQANRDYVKKRKISGSTRSDDGRRCRDTFASLKKTCRKLGISFWHFLMDRIKNAGQIPDLSDLLKKELLDTG